MKKILFFLLLLTFSHRLIFSLQDVENYVQQAPFVVIIPSWQRFNRDISFLMKKFYDKNFTQTKQDLTLQSKSSFGIDIFEDKELERVGIDISKPLVYSHFSNDVGYLLIPVKSQRTFSKYAEKNLSQLNYKFFGDFVAISKEKSLLNNLSAGEKLTGNKAFQIVQKKLDFKWNKYLIWIESKFLSDITSSSGVTLNINIPYGFSCFSPEVSDTALIINGYSGTLSDEQKRFLSSIKEFEAKEKLNFMDYLLPSPAVIMVMNMNIPVLYRYYQFIDKVDILGIKGFSKQLEEKYNVNIEKDIIFNGDGRVRFAIDKFDYQNNEYLVYGVYGLRDPVKAKILIDNLNNAIIKNGEKVYSFEVFTYPFFRYPASNYSVYYGIIENDLIFATDKTQLTNILQKLFKKEGGALEKYPEMLATANSKLNTGAFFYIDMQSFMGNIKGGDIQLNKDFFVNIRDATISLIPDNETGYGWEAKIQLFWNK
ncbi:MAG: hypothetical protein ACP5QT_07605 [Brevinematia bacterium]